MKEYLFLALLALSSTASAVIIRSDTEDAKYQVDANSLPALADFPGEGHGILIYPEWVVTVAHVACMQHHAREIKINGLSREVASVMIHSGYQSPSEALVNETLASGDATKLMTFLAMSDDIALIKLKSPVTDVNPISIYHGRDEMGQTVQLIGKGATGKGNDEGKARGPNRTKLRRAFNVITSVDPRWISYTFDSRESAIPLEGMTGNGDSGSPVLIRGKDGQWQLAGLASWVSSTGEVRMYPGGRYGDRGNSVRISNYINWIESTISAEESREDL